MELDGLLGGMHTLGGRHPTMREKQFIPRRHLPHSHKLSPGNVFAGKFAFPSPTISTTYYVYSRTDNTGVKYTP